MGNKKPEEIDEYLIKINEESEVQDIKELAEIAKKALGFTPLDINELTTRFLNLKDARNLQHQEIEQLKERLSYKFSGRATKDNRIKFLRFILESLVKIKTPAKSLTLGQINYRFQEKAKMVVLDETKEIPSEFIKIETSYKRKEMGKYLEDNGDQEWGKFTNNGEKTLVISQVKRKFKGKI